MGKTYTMHDDKRVTMKLDQVGVSDNAPEWARQQWQATLRQGSKRMTFPYYGGGNASDPICEEVVESLVLDSLALSQEFSEWCDDLGYSADSISALETYKACRKLGARFTRFMA